MSMQPFDFSQAREAAAKASAAQYAAEQFVRDSYRQAALAEERYRVALAEAILRNHDAGVAWTVAPDIARGEQHVAKLRRDRDIAEGVKEAASQAAWRASADRRTTERLIDWSARRDLAEGAGRASEPISYDSVTGTYGDAVPDPGVPA